MNFLESWSSVDTLTFLDLDDVLASDNLFAMVAQNLETNISYSSKQYLFKKNFSSTGHRPRKCCPYHFRDFSTFCSVTFNN
jgi:hypothetical protein